MSQDDLTGVMDPEQTTVDNAAGADTDGDVAPEAHPAAGPSSQNASETRAGSTPEDSAANLEMLMDVDLRVTVELGRANMRFRDVLGLSPGSVVELDKQTSEPVDILVNGALLATGEVVVMDDHFAIRINKLLNRVERLKKVF